MDAKGVDAERTLKEERSGRTPYRHGEFVKGCLRFDDRHE